MGTSSSCVDPGYISATNCSLTYDSCIGNQIAISCVESPTTFACGQQYIASIINIPNTIIPNGHPITDVNVWARFNHTYVGDVEGGVFHNGNGRKLFNPSAKGCSNDGFHVIFDDSSSGPVIQNGTACDSTVPPAYRGTHQPVDALSYFNGDETNGEWKLEIQDAVVNADGIFYEWGIALTVPSYCTDSPTPFPSFNPTYSPSKFPTIYTINPTLIPTQIPSSVPLSITTINPTNDESNEDIIVRLNISFLIIVHNTTRKEIENITLNLLTKKYGNSSINSYKLVAKADNYTGTLDVSFIESKDATTDIINYINTTFSDDISNELDSPNTVQVIIIYVYISDNENNEKQSDLSLSMTKIFEYTNIIIGSVFIFIAIIGFIDAKLFRINDVFKITKILQPMIHILDTISDIFLCLEVWSVYQMNDINESDTFFNISVYFLLFCGMSLFILLPIIISIIQLAVISNKYWIHNRGDTAMNMNNEIVRVWLKKYVYILYIASVLFGSSFSAIILFNSNIFCFRIFDMGLSESTLSHFQTHMIYSIVLFENIPQFVLQIIYWIFIDSLSIIVIISMIYSMFSIVIRIISTYTQKSIMYMEQAIIIRFDVCGTSVTQNADILRNRLDNIGIRLSALFGVQKTLIEVMRPINIANGLQIIFYANITGDINKYLIDFKRFMYEYNRNGSLLCSVKKGWNLSEVNDDKYIIISNINISVKESKQSMDQTVHIQMSNIDNNNNRHKRVNTMSGVYNYNDSNAMSFIPIPMINENNMVTKGQDCKQKTHYLY